MDIFGQWNTIQNHNKSVLDMIMWTDLKILNKKYRFRIKSTGGLPVRMEA